MKKQSKTEKAKVELENYKKNVMELIQNPSRIQMYLPSLYYNKHSPRNLMIANQQLLNRKGHNIEVLKGYRQWQQNGRFVKKGEKGLFIVIPQIVKTGKINEEGEEEKITRFTGGYVFDISQTDGDPIEIYDQKHFKNEYNITYSEMVEKVKQFGYTVKESTGIALQGFTDGKTINVSKNNNETGKILTLLHELGHIRMGHFDGTDKGKSLKELEAETYSYLLGSLYNISSEISPEYVANWNKGKTDNEIEKEFNEVGAKIVETVMTDFKTLEALG